MVVLWLSHEGQSGIQVLQVASACEGSGGPCSLAWGKQGLQHHSYKQSMMNIKGLRADQCQHHILGQY